MSQKYTDPYSGKRKSRRYANRRNHRRRLQSLISATGHRYLAPAGWSGYVRTSNDRHAWKPAEGSWIVEYSRPGYYKQYRTICNRRLRRMRDVSWSGRAGYRKATEFWREVI